MKNGNRAGGRGKVSQIKRDLKRLMTFQTDIRRIKGLTADTKSLIQVRVHTFVNQYYGDYFTCKKIGQFQAHNS